MERSDAMIRRVYTHPVKPGRPVEHENVNFGMHVKFHVKIYPLIEHAHIY